MPFMGNFFYFKTIGIKVLILKYLRKKKQKSPLLKGASSCLKVNNLQSYDNRKLI
jgi:hypothetical protein